MGWLFLLAYACSGLAGLIYEVSWTRLLTLYIGHTTAAASAVAAAFLGGLAVGSTLGGIFATRLSPRRSLQAYVVLELTVAIIALLLPLELKALTPLLKWAYQNGEPGLLFPLVRLATCFEMVFVPAVALGATFPLAIRWYANDAREPARASGALYAVNTTGATIGALLAGFILIPAVGVSGTTRIGMLASLLAATAVGFIVLIDKRRERDEPTTVREVAPTRQTAGKRTKPVDDARRSRELAPIWLPAVVLGVSGFASLMHEIVWTRILALLLGTDDLRVLCGARGRRGGHRARFVCRRVDRRSIAEPRRLALVRSGRGRHCGELDLVACRPTGAAAGGGADGQLVDGLRPISCARAPSSRRR